AEIYFFWNRLPRWEHLLVRLRAKEKLPEIWNPVSGQMTPALAYRKTQQGLEMPLDLPPRGSLFVVLSDTTAAQSAGPGLDPVVSVTRDGRELVFAPAGGEAPVSVQPNGQGLPLLSAAESGTYKLLPIGKGARHLGGSPPGSPSSGTVAGGISSRLGCPGTHNLRTPYLLDGSP
ncbi:MAG TPA: hypothetical protein PL064_11820, partial [Thermogutta sp.]|nr:hypothetical protein [Thermogutta sp.]